MSDIVQWLASHSTPDCDCERCRRHREAADEIERLRANWLTEQQARLENASLVEMYAATKAKAEIERLRWELSEAQATLDNVLARDEQTIHRENVRLRAELQKTLDAGATWERAYWETKQKMLAVAAERDEAVAMGDRLMVQLNDRDELAFPLLERTETAERERDEARKAARNLYRFLANCGDIPEPDTSFKWLEDANTNAE